MVGFQYLKKKMKMLFERAYLVKLIIKALISTIIAFIIRLVILNYLNVDIFLEIMGHPIIAFSGLFSIRIIAVFIYELISGGIPNDAKLPMGGYKDGYNNNHRNDLKDIARRPMVWNMESNKNNDIDTSKSNGRSVGSNSSPNTGVSDPSQLSANTLPALKDTNCSHIPANAVELMARSQADGENPGLGCNTWGEYWTKRIDEWYINAVNRPNHDERLDWETDVNINEYTYNSQRNQYTVSSNELTKKNKGISEILKGMNRGNIPVDEKNIVDLTKLGSTERTELESFVDKVEYYNHSGIRTSDGKIKNSHYLRWGLARDSELRAQYEFEGRYLPEKTRFMHSNIYKYTIYNEEKCEAYAKKINANITIHSTELKALEPKLNIGPNNPSNRFSGPYSHSNKRPRFK
jgi:hypothetical protein